MGAWDATSFGNDTANDWAYGLAKRHNLSYIDSTFQRILSAGEDYIDGSDAEEAIAAAGFSHGCSEDEDWRSIQETLHLVSIPGMRDSIRRGMAEPLDRSSTNPGW